MTKVKKIVTIAVCLAVAAGGGTGGTLLYRSRQAKKHEVDVMPVANMVWQTAKVLNIPIIGLGGISNWKDAVEFMLAGATAIQIGTYNFIDPTVSIKVIDGINDYCDRHGFRSVKEIIGALEV